MTVFLAPIKDVKPGETARVGAAAASIGLACAATRQKFDVMIAAAIARDLTRFDSVTGDAVVLRKGDAVKVLERFGDKQQNAKLQVESGEVQGPHVLLGDRRSRLPGSRPPGEGNRCRDA